MLVYVYAYAIGYSYYRRGELEAETLIKKALEKDPENPAFIDSMAWVLYYKGEYKMAYEMLLKALEKEKEEPVLYEHVGDVLSKWRAFIRIFSKNIRRVRN